MKTKEFGTLIGSFGKGVQGSITVNFTVSGGRHCDDSCPFKGGVCYAETLQKVKPSINVNLTRKESNFSGYLAQLTREKALIKLTDAPWVRFAAFGSIPAPELWTNNDRENLRKIARAVSHGRYHFPVETVAKAQALESLGFYNVRVSQGQANHALSIGFPVSMSVQGSKMARGKNKREYSKPSFELAKQMRSKGVNAKVCPAIAGSAKCGQCTLCGDNNVAVVIYPTH